MHEINTPDLMGHSLLTDSPQIKGKKYWPTFKLWKNSKPWEFSFLFLFLSSFLDQSNATILDE